MIATTLYELDFLQFLQSLRTPVSDQFWVFITSIGDKGMIWIVVTLLLLAFKSTRKIGVISACSLVLSLLITNGLIKNLVERPRPFTYQDVILLVETPTDFSFPSGHTSASFAVAITLLIEALKRRQPTFTAMTIAVLILACTVAFSRLYLFVHFPTDILMGIVIGTICSLLATAIVARVLKNKEVL